MLWGYAGLHKGISRTDEPGEAKDKSTLAKTGQNHNREEIL